MKNSLPDTILGQRLLHWLAVMHDKAAGAVGPYLWIPKTCAVLLSILFLWGIAYILFKTDYFAGKKEASLDVPDGNFAKVKMRSAWEKVRARMGTQDPKEWGQAMLEADGILNEIFKMSGYLGAHTSEKLDLVTEEQLPSLGDVRRADRIAMHIAENPDYDIPYEEALDALRIYKKAFQELNLL